MRDRVNDAMDIHGGRGICDGPTNYLLAGYQTMPVAITVEGANILTRSLITFAQGALRAHPYLYSEIEAAQDTDAQRGLAAFDDGLRAATSASCCATCSGASSTPSPSAASRTVPEKAYEHGANGTASLARYRAASRSSAT